MPNDSIAQLEVETASANGHDLPDIPKPIQAYEQWLCYRLKQKSDGKIDKIPADPGIPGSLGNISKTDPSKWLPCQSAYT